MSGTLILFAHSFSGSTLLTHMLGEHPQVYPVGEYFWRHCYTREQPNPAHPMIHRKSMGGEGSKHYINCERCSRTESLCPVWGHVPMAFPTKELYRSVRHRLRADWIVDSSKQHWWYDEMAKACIDENIIAIRLHKSPWGWLGSKARYEIAGFSNAAPWEILSNEFIETWAKAWAHAMISHHDVLSRHKLSFIDIRYEDFVTDWYGTVGKIWDRIGVDSLNLPTCSAASWGEQHHLGGNAKLHGLVLETLRVKGRDASIPITPDPLAIGPCPELLYPKLETIPAVSRAMSILGRSYD